MEPPLNIDLNIPFNPCDHDYYNINQLPDLNLPANVEDTSLSRDNSNFESYHETQSHEIEVDTTNNSETENDPKHYTQYVEESEEEIEIVMFDEEQPQEVVDTDNLDIESDFEENVQHI